MSFSKRPFLSALFIAVLSGSGILPSAFAGPTLTGKETMYYEYPGHTNDVRYNNCNGRETPCDSADFYIGHACASVTFVGTSKCWTKGGKDCRAKMTYTTLTIDPSLSGASGGKRFWVSSYNWNRFLTNPSEGGSSNGCNAIWGWYQSSGKSYQQFCPLNSQYYTTGMTVAKCEEQFDSNTAYQKCMQSPSAYMGYAGSCGSYGAPADTECYPGSPTYPQCQYEQQEMDAEMKKYQACNCYQSSVQQQKDQCVNQVVRDTNTGLSGDCFCNRRGTVGPRSNVFVDHFVFNQSMGNLECRACPEGMIQDWQEGQPYTKDAGSSCVSVCTVPGQAWRNGQCESCPAGQELNPVTGKCSAPCAPDSIANPTTGACEVACGGMIVRRDPVTKKPITDATGGAVCDCSDSRFPADSRATVSQSTPYAGMSVAAFRYESNLSSGSAGAACACKLPGTTRVSLYDQDSIIKSGLTAGVTAATAAEVGPYGLVPISTGVNTYACGCPNFNEKFELSAGGVYRCVPKFTGEGATLYDVTAKNLAVAADRAKDGIQDSNSDLATTRLAKLRGATDVSVDYARKVWKCREGFLPETSGGVTTCRRPVAADLPKLACSDAGGQLAPSSGLSSKLTAMVAAGTPLDKMTNKRLACCLSDQESVNGVSKFHCAASSPAGYTSFDDYYNAKATNGLDWGLPTDSYPNRLYLVSNDKKPVVGVYKDDGSACDIFTTASPAARMEAMTQIVNNSNDSAKRANPFKGVAGLKASMANDTDSDVRRCRFIVRAAMEVSCPENGVDDYSQVTLKRMEFPISDASYKTAPTAPAQVIRCGKAETVRVHFNVVDASNPGESRRAIMRTLSTVDATGGALSGASAINVKDLIQAK